MSALDRAATVAVVGTGTMGQGIAQVALVSGHPVRLYDVAPGRAAVAVDAIAARLDRLVEKGRLSAAERDAARGRLSAVGELAALADAGLVIEAVVEDMGAKQQLFSALEALVAEECLLATNTSSLSVTRIAGTLRRPGRFVGLHFFNPAPVLPLVEVVSGHATDEAAAERAYATAAAWGKTPVRCSDTPGFIVNRVARPFYAEAFAVYEEGGASPATLDAVLRESGGFRMGPFELTDLIGQDVNAAVSHSVWEAFLYDPKFTPSLAQRRLVDAGLHGRKSGRGWYDHAEGAPRAEPHTAAPEQAPAEVAVQGDLGPAAELVPLMREAGIAVTVAERPPGDASGSPGVSGAPGASGPSGEPAGALLLPDGTRLSLTDGRPATLDGAGRRIVFDLCLDYRSATRVALAPADAVAPRGLADAIGLFQALGKRVSVLPDLPGLIVARTVARIVDIAADATLRSVASGADIDTAMRLGVNYPLGPLAWGDRLGARWVTGLLDALHATWPGGRYAPSPLLRRCAATGRPLSHPGNERGEGAG
ncbi:3-hydroxyacyl-CoA dehydrogenase [Streptomyces sp. URMC 123]|uniref:3-hydroxyacyl-CoA dehydrogenase n=1 Tax=Streptomyces sp. URMC 123 TaxID=3423403 RepID=UPI003F1E0E92